MALMIGGNDGIVIEICVDESLYDGQYRYQAAAAGDGVVYEQDLSLHEQLVIPYAKILKKIARISNLSNFAPI